MHFVIPRTCKTIICFVTACELYTFYDWSYQVGFVWNSLLDRHWSIVYCFPVNSDKATPGFIVLRWVICRPVVHYCNQNEMVAKSRESKSKIWQKQMRFINKGICENIEFPFCLIASGKDEKKKINHEIHVCHNKFLWKHISKDRNRYQKRIWTPPPPPRSMHVSRLTFPVLYTRNSVKMGRMILDIVRKVTSCIVPRIIKPVFVRPHYCLSIYRF